MSPIQITEPVSSSTVSSKGRTVGIDLGTTNSVIAIFDKGKPLALTDTSGHSLIPSAVYYVNGKNFAGHEAFTVAKQNHTQPLQSIKRMMGRSAEEIRQEYQHLPLTMTGEVIMDGRTHTAVSMSADILHHLRTVGQDALGETIEQAVITVPAYFDDAARQATRQAAALIGLDIIRLLNEPTAAALAYGLEHGRQGVYAVYDLGGGTFDISILNLDDGIFQVLSTAGNTALGGDDVDKRIATYLQEHYDLHTISYGTLLEVARALKEQLGNHASSVVVIDGQELVLYATAFETMIAPLITTTIEICGRAIVDAGITMDMLAGVVMVGGSTRLHAVKQSVATFFSCPLYDNLDPDRVVAYGAAIQAHALSEGAQHLLLDVTPLSLGVEMMGGIVEKLIYRNTPIPAQASQFFTTYTEGQTGLQIHVVQGERELAEQCRSLAKFELTDIPPLPAGIARIEVTFTVDADGLLTVAAKEELTGATQQVHVNPSYGLPFESIESMIRESMEFGREDMTARLLVQARVDAARSIEEIRAALASDGELLSGEDNRHINESIQLLELKLQSQDREIIDQLHQRLKDVTSPFAQLRMNHAIKKALAGLQVKNIKA